MSIPLQLRIPGPTPLPERVRQALAQPMVNHRGPEFAALLREVEAGCRTVLETRSDVLVFGASGTGGMESAAANLVSAADPVLVLNHGNFGDRFAQILEAFGAEVDQIAVPWGQAIDPDDVDVALRRLPAARLVVVTHNETSTGVTNDLGAIAQVVKGHGRLLVVDAVSSAASIPVETDRWGIDVVIAGSQKGFMAPPGVVLVAISPAAWEHHAHARAPRFYFDWDHQRRAQAAGSTSSTPAVTVLFGLREAIRLLQEEGLPQVFARHRRVAAAIRAGIQACGLRLFADPEHRSDTVTAVVSPPGLEGDGTGRLLARLREAYGLILAGGQGKMSGKMFRVGHLGMVTDRDALEIVQALERGLPDVGFALEAGAPVEATRHALAGAAALPAT